MKKMCRRSFTVTLTAVFLAVSLLLGGAFPGSISKAAAGDEPGTSMGLSLTPEGWTKIMPSEDSRVIYVSSSEGDDELNDGASPQNPVKTLAKASSLVRDGYPDHILLKRGDVWQGEDMYIITEASPLSPRFINGRSASEPAVISYYGDSGPRPMIKLAPLPQNISSRANFINHNGLPRNFVAIVGLHFYGYKMDPSNAEYDSSVVLNPDALRFVGGGSDILVEDCKLEFAGIVVQSLNSTYTNFKFRRNIVTDVYAKNTSTGNSSRPSGIYADSVDGLLIEENVFDHNGWNATVPGAGANMFNHNMYLQGNNVGNKVVVRGNIVTRASSHGIQGRPGGLYEENLLVENSIGLLIGGSYEMPEDSLLTARNNVILQGKRMHPTESGWPRTPAVYGLDITPGNGIYTMENNIVANRKESGVNRGIPNVAGVSYTGNIQHNWGGGIGDMADPGWLDPQRSVGSYHGDVLGREATLEAFLEAVKNRALSEWPQEYTAYAVNDYIREGFTGASPTPEPTPEPTPVPAIIIDNTDAEFTGTWTNSTAVHNYYGTNYCWNNSRTGEDKVIWRPDIQVAGNYRVYYLIPDGYVDRATNAPFTVHYNGGSQTYLIDQKAKPGGKWILLGTHNFAVGDGGYVELTDNANNTYVIADAVKFERAD